MIRALIALCAFPFLASGQARTGSDIQQGKAMWIGFVTFENDCRLCHGVEAEGGFGPALAGHRLSPTQFLKAVREGAGSMPAFVPDKNLTDQQVGQIAAYLASLPKVSPASTTWYTRVPPLATVRQKLMISSGCGQCHGPIMANPRRTAGGIGADFEWFKNEVWAHTTAPGHANSRHLRMGNYSRRQMPESTLEEIWQFFAAEQGLRVPMGAQVREGVVGPKGTTYTVTIQNSGTPGKGLTAEYVTITLPLLVGGDPEEVTTLVTASTGDTYVGVHRDPITNSQAAQFEIPGLAPGEKRTYTLTLSGRGANVGIPRGTVTWELPRLNSGGTDQIAVSVPRRAE